MDQFYGLHLVDSVGSDTWNYLLHPDDQTRVRTMWGHLLDTGANYEIATGLRRGMAHAAGF